MTRLLLVLACLAGCDQRTCGPEAQWQLSAAGSGEFEVVRDASDGSLVAVFQPYVQFGGGPHLLRIDSTGAITTDVAVLGDRIGPHPIQLDGTGAPTITWGMSCTGGAYEECDPQAPTCSTAAPFCARSTSYAVCSPLCSTSEPCPLQNGVAVYCNLAKGTCVPSGPPTQCLQRVVKYDRDFNIVWSLRASSITIAVESLLEVAPSGEAAFIAPGDGLLTYVDATGTVRWMLPSDARKIRMADNGDLFELDRGDVVHRLRRAAIDGAIVEDIALPVTLSANNLAGSIAERDGGVVAIMDPFLSFVTRLDGAGTTRWTRPMQTIVSSPLVDASDDLLAITALGTQAIRFDGITGETRGVRDNCDLNMSTDLVSADGRVYVTRIPGRIAQYMEPTAGP